ncbi:MAG: fumarylacetoacetate hydrolase family protein [Candidatus Micrarchaeota archaeon]|nr:fumarylacetoacetate hydrolase family protein [Candidatus Micrarchaeota archaeon]
MKLGRVVYNNKEYYAVFDADKEIAHLYEHEFYNYKNTFSVKFKDLKFLPPVKPTNIISMGFNYLEHFKEAKERGMTVPELKEPLITLKGVNSITAHLEKITIPKQTNLVEIEGEFVIVIARTCKNVTEQEAEKCILGYTLANDVTARDLQFMDGQWARSKSIDGFCPLGPWIETELDPLSVEVITYLNSTEVQKTNTSMLFYNAYKLISHVSKYMTLFPGDVILTGTPSGVKAVRHGDRVDIVAKGLGKLTNIFVKSF